MKIPRRILSDSSGFVLATIIVFIVVLTLSGYLVAGMTRTDVQVVNNIANEKEAFFRGEAGVTEALLRLDWSGGTVTVNGNTFDPKIDPDKSDPNWMTFVVFSGTGPVTSGSVVTTPTIQPAANRLPYSTTTLPAVCTSGVSYSRAACEALQLYWEPDGSGGIAETPGGRAILNLISTGQSGNARRRIHLQLVEDAGGQMVFWDSAACAGLQLNGGADIDFEGTVYINSGCAQGRNTALNLGNNNTLDANGVEVVGGYNGRGAVDPAPNTGVAPIPDPLQHLTQPPPGAPSTVADCGAVTSMTRVLGNINRTFSPGVYCGGIELNTSGTVTFAPGIYHIAGGQLKITGSGTYNAVGVMFYVTNYPGNPPNNWASVTFGPNGAANFRAPTAAELGSVGAPLEYEGILLFQNRQNAQPVEIKGSFQDGLDGVLYARQAELIIQNQPGIPARDLNIEAVVGSGSFNGDTNFLSPTTPVVSNALPGDGLQTIAWSD